MMNYEYRKPPWRVRNVGVFMFIVGTVLLFCMGLWAFFAQGRDIGIAMVALPTAINLLVKMGGQDAVNTLIKDKYSNTEGKNL